VGCDLAQYENKVETIVAIHSKKNLGENIFEGFQKPSQMGHLQINVACIRMPS
jgi:hypothetical protein